MILPPPLIHLVAKFIHLLLLSQTEVSRRLESIVAELGRRLSFLQKGIRHHLAYLAVEFVYRLFLPQTGFRHCMELGLAEFGRRHCGQQTVSRHLLVLIMSGPDQRCMWI